MAAVRRPNPNLPGVTTNVKTKRLGVYFPALAALGCAVGPLRADVSHRVLLKTGDDASLFGPALTFSSTLPGLSDPAINETGEVVALVVLAGPGITDVYANGFALVGVSDTGALRRIVRGGDAVDGFQGVTFSTFGFPNINSAGRVLFPATLAGTGVTTANDQALCVEQPGRAPVVLAREGAAAPGLAAGLTIATVDVVGPAFNSLGQCAFTISLTGPGVTTANSSALYLTSAAVPTTPILVVRSGDAAAFAGAGVFFGGSATPLLTPGGDLIFQSTLAGASISTSNDRALVLYRAGSGTFSFLMRKGDAIPGYPGYVWGSTLTAALTPAGTLVFWAQMVGPVAQSALWVGPSDGSAPFRRAGANGTPAMGLGVGQSLNVVTLPRYAAADDGRTSFASSIAGTGVITANDTGMFTEGPDGVDSPRLVAREGSPAAGVSPAVNHPTFTETNVNTAINVRHQTVFFSRAPIAGVTDMSDVGLFAVDAVGTTSLLAYKNQPFTVAPGDVRTIGFVGYRIYSTPSSAWRTWFNNLGQLVYPLGFTGASGVSSALVVSTIDPIAPPCLADFNGVGGATVQDLFDFLDAWFDGLPAADFNGVGGVTVQDLFDFLDAWFVGCP